MLQRTDSSLSVVLDIRVVDAELIVCGDPVNDDGKRVHNTRANADSGRTGHPGAPSYASFESGDRPSAWMFRQECRIPCRQHPKEGGREVAVGARPPHSDCRRQQQLARSERRTGANSPASDALPQVVLNAGPARQEGLPPCVRETAPSPRIIRDHLGVLKNTRMGSHPIVH